VSIPSWARVGAKVVYIYRGPTPTGRYAQEVRPLAGEIYTVRDVITERDGDGFRLVEIRNPEMLYSSHDGCHVTETYFAIRSFRPLITRTQADDIELFRPLLNPSLDELAERNRRQGDEIDAQLERLRSAIRFNNAVEAA